MYLKVLILMCSTLYTNADVAVYPDVLKQDPLGGPNVCQPESDSNPCCTGWIQTFRHGPCARPLCDPPCSGGVCIRPNMCKCRSGQLSQQCTRSSRIQDHRSYGNGCRRHDNGRLYGCKASGLRMGNSPHPCRRPPCNQMPLRLGNTQGIPTPMHNIDCAACVRNRETMRLNNGVPPIQNIDCSRCRNIERNVIDHAQGFHASPNIDCARCSQNIMERVQRTRNSQGFPAMPNTDCSGCRRYKSTATNRNPIHDRQFRYQDRNSPELQTRHEYPRRNSNNGVNPYEIKDRNHKVLPSRSWYEDYKIQTYPSRSWLERNNRIRNNDNTALLKDRSGDEKDTYPSRSAVSRQRNHSGYRRNNLPRRDEVNTSNTRNNRNSEVNTRNNRNSEINTRNNRNLHINNQKLNHESMHRYSDSDKRSRTILNQHRRRTYEHTIPQHNTRQSSRSSANQDMNIQSDQDSVDITIGNRYANKPYKESSDRKIAIEYDVLKNNPYIVNPYELAANDEARADGETGKSGVLSMVRSESTLNDVPVSSDSSSIVTHGCDPQSRRTGKCHIDTDDITNIHIRNNQNHNSKHGRCQGLHCGGITDRIRKVLQSPCRGGSCDIHPTSNTKREGSEVKSCIMPFCNLQNPNGDPESITEESSDCDKDEESIIRGGCSNPIPPSGEEGGICGAGCNIINTICSAGEELCSGTGAIPDGTSGGCDEGGMCGEEEGEVVVEDNPCEEGQVFVEDPNGYRTCKDMETFFKDMEESSDS